MSVSHTVYLMFGAKVDPDSFDFDEFEAEVNGDPNRRFDVVYDCMCGEYCVAGKILAFENVYEDSLGMVTIDLEKMIGDKDALAKAVSEAFDLNLGLEDFQPILFSHYS